ncbi:MAG: ATP-binding protein [Flavobacteriaceae bacterium]|nr:ATP-binding protein [Flavobacteriaceae bacterium]
MLKRLLENKIKKTLEISSSIALLGSRQVGKTTLAKQLSKTIDSVYFDLEDNLDLIKVQDMKLLYEENKNKLIVLDEIQKIPESFPQFRGLIDKERQNGNKSALFLFLGSASMDLLKQSSESLAGRISYFELFPLNIKEIKNTEITNIHKLWIRGGFPDSYLSKNNQNSLEWRINFIKTYLERDIPQFGPRIPVETLRRFWTMLAHKQGSTINVSNLARNLDVSGTTVIRYLDLMVDLLLVRQLKPYTFNIGKRLVKAPKIFVRDSGITHALLNIKDFEDLISHPVVGGSWEGFVIENIASILQLNINAFYYRTTGGAEIDLILEFSITELWAIEIKRSSAPKISKGFHIACEDIKATRKFLVYSGNDTFSIKNDITVISLFDMMNKIIEFQ